MDTRAYERAVGAIASAIDRHLLAGVLANRVDRRGRPLPFMPARRAWERAIAGCATTGPRDAALLADVRRCYRSIGVPAVDSALRSIGIGSAHRAPVLEFLERLEHAGIHGLPIGPAPSAVLANGVLAIADAAAARTGARVFRWVDDVVFVGPGPRAASAAFDAWALALNGLGLTPHEGKLRRVVAIGEGDPGFASRCSPVGEAGRAMLRS